MRRLCLLAFLFILHPAVPAVAGETTPKKKPLAVEDLYLMDGPSAAVLSPDGQRLAYIRQWIDPATKKSRNSLWTVDGPGQKPRPLEADQPDARSPVFSPDGKWIAFLSTRPRPKGWKQIPPTPPESDPATDIWLIPADGGAAIPLAGPIKLYGRVFNDGFYGRLAFSPDGKKLAFVADNGDDPRTKQEIENDVLIVRPDQGEGYTKYRPAQIWLATLDPAPKVFAAAKIESLTADDFWYGDPQWSPDGKTLVVHANLTADQESARFSINKNFDLWAIDVQTRKVTQLTTGPGPEVSPRIAPDGKSLVCLSVPRKGSHRDTFNLLVVPLGKSGQESRVVFNHHSPNVNNPPHPSPSFPLPEDCWDGGEHVVVSAEQGTKTGTIRIHLPSGQGQPLDFFKKGVKPDLATVPGRLLQRAALIPAGNLFLKDRLLAAGEVITWNNREGMEIEGILTLPPSAVAKPPYKMLLYPHGGPHSRSALGFNFTVQFFAAKGYAVFQPNFRGSSGYGQKFIDADRHDFGGGDMRDILTGIDSLVKKKLVDPKQQYVYGISYGGFMTCWLVGHTDQFRAAVTQNAVTDLNAMWGLSDIQSWTEWEFRGRPWEIPQEMAKHSPITYAGKIKTPTLILHSRDDRRCPLPMGKMFYQALLSRQIPTQMVIYPDEGHGIRQPRHQVDVLQRTLAWFAEFEGK